MSSRLRTRARTLALIALVCSLGLNVALMLRYRVPRPLFALLEPSDADFPDIPLSSDLPALPAPSLAFPAAAEALDGFPQWRETASARLRELLTVRDGEGPPSVRVVSRTSVGSLTREALVVTQRDGQETPAFLFLPDSAEPRPALVVMPGFSRGIVGTAGIFEDYQHAMALRLAEAGYVTMCTEIRGLGYLYPIGEAGSEMRTDSFIGYSLMFGQSLPGLMVSDGVASLDYLASRDEVDGGSLGVVGFSLGGKAAVYLAAIDTRVKAAVASGCVMSYEANFRYARHGSEDAVPGLGLSLRFADCLGLIAPRPALVHWGELDSKRRTRNASFNASSLPTFDEAGIIYAAAGARDNLEKSITTGVAHEFDNEAAIRFLNRRLPVPGDRE